MAIFAWVSIIIVLTLLFDAWLKKTQGPKVTTAKVISVEGVQKTIIPRNHQNHYVVRGKVNDEAVIFIIDTGASDVVIPGALAEKLKLKKGPSSMANTAAGLTKIQLTKLQSITIGHIQIHDVYASISPSMTGDEVLLGMSALQYVNFSQNGDQLILTTQR